MSTAEHITDANTCLAESSEIQGWTAEDRLILATRAQASATLALVEEQRTANLIAWCTANGEEPHLEHAKLINERLGLV